MEKFPVLARTKGRKGEKRIALAADGREKRRNV